MTAAVVYRVGRGLYVNLTNRCPNECTFCLAADDTEFAGVRLRFSPGEPEPSADDVVAAVEAAGPFDELVFCGFGEPWERVDVIIASLRRLGLPPAVVRVNTNGQGFLVAPRERLAQLRPLADRLSVSLNAPDGVTYDRLCRPRAGEAAFDAVCDFITTARDQGFQVTASAVASSGVDMRAVADLAGRLGVPFRAR